MAGSARATGSDQRSKDFRSSRSCGLGAAAGCTCPAEITSATIGEARRQAADVHTKFEHPGTPDACQSSHDVLCKAVW